MHYKGYFSFKTKGILEGEPARQKIPFTIIPVWFIGLKPVSYKTLDDINVSFEEINQIWIFNPLLPTLEKLK